MNTINTQKSQAGFTLIELMIVVAIIGILASIAVPAYQNYTLKSKFTEVINASQPFKSAVELCINDLNTETGCTSGTNGIPAQITNLGKYVSQVDATNGTVTAIATAVEGLNSQTFVLVPTYTQGKGIEWSNSTSTCLTDQICNPVGK